MYTNCQCQVSHIRYEVNVRLIRTTGRKRKAMKTEEAGGQDERSERQSHQLENHCSMAAGSNSHTHTYTHQHTHTGTLHSNVRRNFLTRREKGQWQHACGDLFSLQMLLFLVLCCSGLIDRHQTGRAWRLLFSLICPR